jgi:hypothetical protein
MNLLKGTTLERFVASRSASLSKQYKLLQKAIPDFKVSEEEYYSIVNLVYSRTFAFE